MLKDQMFEIVMLNKRVSLQSRMNFVCECVFFTKHISVTLIIMFECYDACRLSTIVIINRTYEMENTKNPIDEAKELVELYTTQLDVAEIVVFY